MESEADEGRLTGIYTKYILCVQSAIYVPRYIFLERFLLFFKFGHIRRPFTRKKLYINGSERDLSAGHIGQLITELYTFWFPIMNNMGRTLSTYDLISWKKKKKIHKIKSPLVHDECIWDGISWQIMHFNPSSQSF